MVRRRRNKKEVEESISRRRQTIKDVEFIEYIKELLILENGRLMVDVLTDQRNFLVVPSDAIGYNTDCEDMLEYDDLYPKLLKEECFVNKDSRKMQYTLPRHAFFHIVKNYHGKVTFSKMGRTLGFDHSTILHGCRNADKLLQINYKPFVNIYMKCLDFCGIKTLNLKTNNDKHDTVCSPPGEV